MYISNTSRGTSQYGYIGCVSNVINSSCKVYYIDDGNTVNAGSGNLIVRGY